jgi:hypothetical protein
MDVEQYGNDHELDLLFPKEPPREFSLVLERVSFKYRTKVFCGEEM